MSDAFEIVERARPEIDPITPEDRRKYREELFHEGRRAPQATAAAMVVPWQTRRRSRQLVVAVAVLLVLGIGAIVVFRANEGDDEAAPADTAAATTTTASTAPPTTAAGGARLPVRFAPLLLDEPPKGYRLHWARFAGAELEDAVGLARYTPDGGGPEIALFMRPTADTFTGPIPRRTPRWRVAGRRVKGNPASGQCTDSVCSVDVQWNDRTALSVSWVNWDGTPLRNSVTQEELIEFVRSLEAQPGLWEAGPIDSEDPSWDTPRADAAALLLPGAGLISADHQRAWPGSSSAVVRAPDDSFLSIQEGDGPAVELDPERLVQVKGVAVDPPTDANERPLSYELSILCGFAHVADQPGSSVLRPVVRRLLGGISLERGEIVVDLPQGWSKVRAGDHRDTFVATFTVPFLSADTALTFIQSPGGTPSAFMFGRGPFRRIGFLDGRAWLEVEPDDGVTRIIGTRSDTAYEISASGVTVAELEAAIESLEPATMSTWFERFGEAAPVEGDRTCPQQPFLTVNAPRDP